MEHHETQHQKGPTPPLEESLREAPPSLLSGVLRRLDQREHYFTQRSCQALLDALHHQQWEIRAAAVHALEGSDLQAPLEPLIAALQDEHRLVRAAAVRALGRLAANTSEASTLVDYIFIALRDEEWEVREMAVLTLGERDEPAVRPLLQAALQDTNSSVREVAATALSRYNAALPAHQAEAKTSALASAAPAARSLLLQRIARSVLLLKRQVALIHRSLWIGPPLLLLLLGLFSFLGGGLTHDHVHMASLYLALFTTISAAAGTAFIYGGENDPGLELTLSTPTSLRGIMFARFLLVVGYNILLSACASAALGLLHGGGFWEIMQLWLGPMVLLASFTLTLSMLIGSWIALAAALIVEISQSFAVNAQQHWLQVELSFSGNWHTTPAILCLAALLIAFAVLSMPRQPRLSQL
ncbi:MAG TPA: HEAT repeat domain-containing protein [Ktedonobacteraceae bacterium]